jgi:hypothetical protein
MTVQLLAIDDISLPHTTNAHHKLVHLPCPSTPYSGQSESITVWSFGYIKQISKTLGAALSPLRAGLAGLAALSPCLQESILNRCLRVRLKLHFFGPQTLLVAPGGEGEYPIKFSSNDMWNVRSRLRPAIEMSADVLRGFAYLVEVTVCKCASIFRRIPH